MNFWLDMVKNAERLRRNKGTKMKRKGNTSVLKENWKDGVLYFTFPLLEAQKEIVHGFSSRIGGVSEREFAQMNLSFSRGDEEAHVQENYSRIAAAIGFEKEKIVCSVQTHTINVREVTEEDCGKGVLRGRDYTDVDGLMTDVPGVVLTTFYADCVPLYFADPIHHAVGLAHSGWRGTVNNIAGEMVRKMNARYGTAPSDLYTAIGPSICQDCYEVSEDVIDQFRAAYPQELWPKIFCEQDAYRSAKEQREQSDVQNTEAKIQAANAAAGSERKFQLNLWEACRQNLLRAGVRPERIETTDLCTCCNPDIFFSHRASHGKRGNLAAFLGIRE